MKNIKNLLTILFITLTGYVFAQNGVNCATPIFINTLPYTQNGVNTSSFGNNYSSTDACGSVNMNGNDIVYEYTPANDTCVTIGITGAVFTAGVFLVENCPDDASSSCVRSAIGSSASFTASVLQGATYYIIVSTDNSPASTPFNISVQEVDCATNLPTVQDCDGAIPLCFGAEYSEDSSWIGIGNVDNEFSTANTCIGTSGISGDVER